MVKAVLTDIEGTTSSISFVKDVLFPYAKERLPSFLRENAEEVKEILKEVEAIEGKPLSLEGAIDTLLRWIDEDKKATPLKELQGLIWEEGYAKGELKGHVYEDAYRKLKELHQRGIPIYVYSSGSVKAQILLFSNTNYGDLTHLFSGYFDTKVGNKKDSTSYEKISERIGVNPENILFLSDSPEEIEAAASVGMQVIRFAREGENELIEGFPFQQVKSFEEITII